MADSAGNGKDWSAVETGLGVTLPGEHKAFIDTYGPGSVDDHVHACAPDAAEEWADLVAQKLLRARLRRRGALRAGQTAADWHLGDVPYGKLDREDIPAWFEPGDDLISWGHTGNGDFLFWHVKPGTAPHDWPVMLKEEGPL